MVSICYVDCRFDLKSHLLPKIVNNLENQQQHCKMMINKVSTNNTDNQQDNLKIAGFLIENKNSMIIIMILMAC